MSHRVITELDQVTPAWLTAVLSRSDALINGAVSAFEADAGGGNWSSNVRLAVRYADGSLGTMPDRLFLKMVNTDLDDESFGPSEVTYYTRDYIDLADAPLVHCYHAVFSPGQRRYHILLDDLSETHVIARDKSPTLAYGLALAEGLAAMHARWWGAQGLAEADAPIHEAGHIQHFVDLAELGADHLLSQLTSELEPHWPAAIRNLFANHPRAIIERTRDADGFTVVHGDVGAGNVLAPRKGERPIYIIDRQPFDWSLTTWLGAYDLAYAIVLDWDVARRRQWELPVLRHYHAQLLRRGIQNYPWERLFDDYRLCVAMGVYIATEYFRGGDVRHRWAWVWMRMLQRSLIACEDLNCSELW